MITRPLELESRLSPPPRDLDFVAWVSVGLIALFFTLLGSRFVLAPGFLIGVGGDGFQLPTVGVNQPAPTAGVVINYRQDDAISFEGELLKLPGLRERLQAYAKQHPGEILLVIADRRVSAQALADLTTMATAAGFSSVQMAAETPAANNGSK